MCCAPDIQADHPMIAFQKSGAPTHQAEHGNDTAFQAIFAKNRHSRTSIHGIR